MYLRYHEKVSISWKKRVANIVKGCTQVAGFTFRKSSALFKGAVSVKWCGGKPDFQLVSVNWSMQEMVKMSAEAIEKAGWESFPESKQH